MLLTLLTSTREQWCLGAQALSVVPEEGQGGEDFPDVPSSLAGTSGVALETLDPLLICPQFPVCCHSDTGFILKSHSKAKDETFSPLMSFANFTLFYAVQFPEKPGAVMLTIPITIPGPWSQHTSEVMWWEGQELIHSHLPFPNVTGHLAHHSLQGLPRWLSGKESACQCRRRGFDPGVGKVPWRRKWHPTPVFLPGERHGQRSLGGTVHGVIKESGTT